MRQVDVLRFCLQAIGRSPARTILMLMAMAVGVAAVGFAMGNAHIEGNQRQRRTTVYGTDPGFPVAYKFAVALGGFLPDDNPHAPRPTAVLGSTVRDELFGDSNPLGTFIRIAGNRYRVVGVMESKGQMLGFDLDDTVYLPAARAMELFNQESLLEIDLLYEEYADVEEVVARVKRLLAARHGSDDVNITSQQQVMDVLGSILRVLTTVVAALGGISLVVGGIGNLTIMTIVVRERTNEIGLFRALGASRNQILTLFLGEAVIMATLGGVAGLIIGVGGAQTLSLLVPALPVHTSWRYVLLSLVIAMTIGLLAGVLPALRAARMLPVNALRAEWVPAPTSITVPPRHRATATSLHSGHRYPLIPRLSVSPLRLMLTSSIVRSVRESAQPSSG